MIGAACTAGALGDISITNVVCRSVLTDRPCINMTASGYGWPSLNNNNDMKKSNKSLYVNLEKIDKMARNAVEKLNQQRQLCHYTALNSMVGMLAQTNSNNNKALNFWASSIYAMNDPEEIMFGYDCLWDALPMIEKELNIDGQKRISKIWKRLKTKEKDKYYKELVKEGLKKKDKMPFVISLSTKVDTLDMWQVYANKGCGVCIVFKEGALNISGIKPMKIEYLDKASQGSIPYKVMKELYKEEYLDKCQIHNELHEALSFFSSVVMGIAPYIKKKDFEFESEYRIVSITDMKANVKTRISKNNNIVPYIEYPMSIEAIERIILGPCIDATKNKSLLEVTLKSKSIDIPVNISSKHLVQY